VLFILDEACAFRSVSPGKNPIFLGGRGGCTQVIIHTEGGNGIIKHSIKDELERK